MLRNWSRIDTLAAVVGTSAGVFLGSVWSFSHLCSQTLARVLSMDPSHGGGLPALTTCQAEAVSPTLRLLAIGVALLMVAKPITNFCPVGSKTLETVAERKRRRSPRA
jgi:hypothetical protein